MFMAGELLIDGCIFSFIFREYWCCFYHFYDIYLHNFAKVMLGKIILAFSMSIHSEEYLNTFTFYLCDKQQRGVICCYC
jgi:hypothetical protein